VFVLVYLVNVYQRTWASYLSSQRHLLQCAKICFSISLVFWLINGYLNVLDLRFSWFDIGIYASVVNSVAKQGTFYNSLMGMNEFGDHFSPILMLFAPLFKLTPSVLWLYWAKIAAHFYAVWRIYRFAEKQQAGVLLLTMILFVGSSHELISSALKFEFSPSALALPLVVLAFELCFAKKFDAVCAILIALLFFKESMVLVWIAVGLYLIIEEKKYVFGSSLICCGFLIGYLIVGVLMPHYNNGSTHHTGSISVVEQLPQKVASLFSMVFLLVPVMLLRPQLILVALPMLGLIFLGSDAKPTMATLEYHYHDIAYVGMGILGVIAYLKPSRIVMAHREKVKFMGVILLGWGLLSSDHFPSRDNLGFDYTQAMQLKSDAERLNLYLEDKLPEREIVIQQELCPYFIGLSYPKSASILKPHERAVKRPLVYYGGSRYNASKEYMKLLMEMHEYSKMEFGGLTLYY
jgi:uncharacterized membrane protein